MAEALKPLNLSLARTTNIFQIFQAVPCAVMIAVGVAILVIVGLGIANIEPVRVAVFATATPTITPLPFEPAAEGETLILLAEFHETAFTHSEPTPKSNAPLQKPPQTLACRCG